jgi:hypothetical protein
MSAPRARTSRSSVTASSKSFVLRCSIAWSASLPPCEVTVRTIEHPNSQNSQILAVLGTIKRCEQ